MCRSIFPPPAVIRGTPRYPISPAQPMTDATAKLISGAEAVRRVHAVGIVLVALAAVVVVVHVVRALLGVALGALAVIGVHALCLGQLVHLGAGKTRDELFGEGVGDGLALFALVVLERCLMVGSAR